MKKIIKYIVQLCGLFAFSLFLCFVFRDMLQMPPMLDNIIRFLITIVIIHKLKLFR